MRNDSTVCQSTKSRCCAYTVLSALRDPDVHIVTPAVDFLERFAQVLRLSITSIVQGVSTVAAEYLGVGDLGTGRALGSQLLVCPYSDECRSYLRFVLLFM